MNDRVNMPVNRPRYTVVPLDFDREAFEATGVSEAYFWSRLGYIVLIFRWANDKSRYLECGRL